MSTYPTEIYVRSTDADNKIVDYVKARYLTDNSGNYIFNPGVEKFNVFVKDANGQYVSYLAAAQQAHTATPYISRSQTPETVKELKSTIRPKPHPVHCTKN